MMTDCGALAEATRGCRVLLLAATALEAEPVGSVLVDVGRLTATNTAMSVGEYAGVRVALAVSGCDKVNAAVTLTALLQAMRPSPELVLQVGIAGGFAAGGAVAAASPGDLVIATQEAYSDLGSSSPDGWISAGDLALPIAQIGGRESGGVFLLDPSLVHWAVEILGAAELCGPEGAGESPAVLAGPCITASTVTGKDEEAQVLVERWGALAESMEGAAAAHVCALFGVPFLELRGISNLVGDRDRSSWLVDRAAQTAGRAALALVAALADGPRT